MSEKQPPILTFRDKSFSASVFKKEHDSKTFYGICIQRSYKRNKESDKWEREQINIFPEDLLRLSALLQDTYRKILDYSQAKKPTTTAVEYQAAKEGWDAQEDGFDDDIPF